MSSNASTDLSEEQGYVSMLYGRLDEMRERAADRLATSLREPTGGTHQARSERDSAATLYTDQAARYGAVEAGLCFGRLDLDDGERRYIGRIGIFDSDGGYEPLLMDWRAPAARPFYLATAASPGGVLRRRHIRTKDRTVVALDDEVLDLAAARDARAEALVGEAALFAALSATRTGRMRDIVETIQAEQDRIIRARPDGVLVVQGGPGTGKTAVALHRAAYLLYTYRRELSTRGVLIVGPNETFLRYISQVLPSLAETGVLLRTLGDLVPGVSARRPEPAEAAEIKGRHDMVRILANAVRDRLRSPDDVLDIDIEGGDSLTVDRDTCARARAAALRSGRPHNLARPLFDTEIVHVLAEQIADRIGTDPYAHDPLGADPRDEEPLGVENVLDEADRAEIRRELRAEPAVRAALDWMWPILTPRQLLADLFESDERLATAAPDLTAAERALLLRDRRGGWSPADVPLLDEAAELLGEDDRMAAALAERHRRRAIEYAQGALEIALGSRPVDVEDDEDAVESELLTATDLIDAERLAERHSDAERLTAAERAAADREWSFGHIIVDEAQELSPMAWRLLMRRSPNRSITVVGDVAQTGDLSGTSSWQRVLDPYVGDRWRLEELTISYRTPAEIMAYASKALPDIGEPPRSVRESGVEPWDLTVDPERWVEHVIAEADQVGEGRLGVIGPVRHIDWLGRAVAEAVPDAATGDRPDLESRVVVLTVRQAKGLEFDSVVVVDPDRIVADSPRGTSDLYVALTRATQRLGVLRPVPPR